MTLINRFQLITNRLERIPMSLLLLLARIGVGMVFFKAGLLKYESFEFTVLLFRDEYKVPFLDPEFGARMAMVQELALPMFLFLGLGTRLATLPLFGMLFVIQTFVYPNAWADHLYWAGTLLLILAKGPGVLSIDHLISRRFQPASVSGSATGA
jgi:putative oxidoreductase